MACGYTVNSEAFREGAWETAGLYINTYPWCCMPPSVHKILIHGADITENVSLRIGMMSEETLKARTNDFLKILEHHTRKNSRLNVMKDILHHLLIFSDPLISSKSKSNSKLAGKIIK